MKKQPFHLNQSFLKELLVRMLCLAFATVPQVLPAQNGPNDAEKILLNHKTYFEVSQLALDKAFVREKQRLLETAGASGKSQAQFDYDNQNLQKQYDYQWIRLNNIANKYAKVIHAEWVDSLYWQALELFKSGEIETCKQYLESARLLDQVQVASQQQWGQIDPQKEEKYWRNLAALALLADLYQITLETDKAESLFDELLRWDHSLSLQKDAAAFYQGNQRAAKALEILPSIVTNPELGKEDKPRIYEQMGDLYTSLGQFEPALGAYLEHQKLNAELLEANPDRFLVREQLAVAQEKIGMTYCSMGNLESALAFFEERFRLGQALLKTNPKENRYKKGMMVAYAKLGETHAALSEPAKALGYFKHSLKMAQEQNHRTPQNVQAISDLAVAYFNLGETYTALGNLEKALVYFKETDRLVQQIFELEPQSQLFSKYRNAYGSRALALFNLSSKEGDSKKKEVLLEQSLADYRRALKNRNDNAEVLSNMGMIYFMRNQLDSAETVYRKAVGFAPAFVDAGRNLGVIMAIKKNFPAAIEQWKATLEYADEKQSAILCFYIGSAFIDMDKQEESTQWLEKAYSINPSLRQ